MTEQKPPECPRCQTQIGYTQRHRLFCPHCGQPWEQRLTADPRVRHTAAEGERRLKHGEQG